MRRGQRTRGRAGSSPPLGSMRAPPGVPAAAAGGALAVIAGAAAGTADTTLACGQRSFHLPPVLATPLRPAGLARGQPRRRECPRRWRPASSGLRWAAAGQGGLPGCQPDAGGGSRAAERAGLAGRACLHGGQPLLQVPHCGAALGRPAPAGHAAAHHPGGARGSRRAGWSGEEPSALPEQLGTFASMGCHFNAYEHCKHL